jgi:hypothetical protein
MKNAIFLSTESLFSFWFHELLEWPPLSIRIFKKGYLTKGALEGTNLLSFK